MPKLLVTEAEKLVAVKKSTIYADTDSGKVSFEINLAGIKSSQFSISDSDNCRHNSINKSFPHSPTTVF